MPSFQLPFPQSTERLIRQMGGRDNNAALKAATELQERLYFQNGLMHGADLSNANLMDARLACASLREVNFCGALLAGAYFGSSDLQSAKLQNAVLRAGNLREVKLRNADLTGADLTQVHMALADLRGAKLQGAQMHSANLWRAKLQGADLTGAVLTDVNFYLTEFDRTTILPDSSMWTPQSDLTRFTGREHSASLTLDIAEPDALV